MEQRTIPVSMRSCGNASDADFAPLLDGLQTTFANVTAAIGPPQPDHPGGTGPFPFTLELAFDIAKAGEALHATAVVAQLGADEYQMLRQHIVEMRRQTAETETVAPNFPLSIRFGTSQFSIDTPLTEQEWREALVAAAALMQSMLDERIIDPSGGAEWPITWDADARAWRDA